MRIKQLPSCGKNACTAVVLPTLMCSFVPPFHPFQVTFRSYKRGGGSAQDGHLQLDGGSTFLLFSPVSKKNRPIKHGPTKTTMSSIDEVLLEDTGGENIGRVLVRSSICRGVRRPRVHLWSSRVSLRYLSRTPGCCR